MDWTHGCGWGRVWGMGIADCRYAGGQLTRSTAWRPGRTLSRMTVDQMQRLQCMTYCSADVVTARVTVSAYRLCPPLIVTDALVFMHSQHHAAVNK